MTDVVSGRQQAFELLRSAVARLQAEGRSTRSAGVKPMLQFSEMGFDERRLGYRTFRAFIEAAAEDGYVTVERASRGPDVELRALLGGVATPSGAPERIRRDLWSAFVDWRREWDRLYDRQTDRVGWLPNDHDHGEPFATFRADVEAERTRFVTIEPFSPEQTEDWMRAFVGSLDEGGARSALESALTSSRPIRAFVRIALQLGIKDQWNSFRAARVRERIEGWADENELTVDLQVEQRPITMPSLRRPPGSPRPRQDTWPSDRVSLENLRDQVCAAVKQMSRADLLRLPIPLEYVITSER